MVAPSTGWLFDASVTVPLIMPVAGLDERATVPRSEIEPAVMFIVVDNAVYPVRETVIVWFP